MFSILLSDNNYCVAHELNISFVKEGVENANKHDFPYEEKKCDVLCYSDFKLLKSFYNFKSNGFEYFDLYGDLLDKTISFQKNPFGSRTEENLLKEAVKYMSSWGKENLPDYKNVVPLELAYRDNSPYNSTGNKAFFLAHVDFNKDKLQRIMESSKEEWKPNIETVLGDLSDEEYGNLKIMQIVNLWLSLDLWEVNNTLALLDTKSIDPQKDLRPLKNNGLDIMSIGQNSKQNWVALKGMTMGQGIIFNTFRTPHTAVELPRDPSIKFYRKSVEIRLAFLS